jgi:hypothetical protein
MTVAVIIRESAKRRRSQDEGFPMKLRLCIAIVLFALLGGVASAVSAMLLPAHADPCGGYSCSALSVSDDL